MLQQLRASARLTGVAFETGRQLAHFMAVRPFLSDREQRQFALKLIHRWGGNLVRLLSLDIKVHGTPPSIPSLLVGNHRSYLDIAVLASVHPCLFLAKQEISTWPLFGTAAAAGGMVFVKRSDAADRRRVLGELRRRLETNASVVVFPEGTTTAGPGISSFRPGVFKLGHECRTRIVPFAVRYDDNGLAWVGEDTFVGHFLRTQGVTGNTAHIHFGQAIQPRDFSDPEALRVGAQGTVAKLLGEHERELCPIA
jgi:1-acyl-sn-glycerol-3-phosphate acyltransferase